MPAGTEQEVVNAEFARFGKAPGRQPLAADAILEAMLAFDHQHARATRRHRPRQCRAAEATADDDEVVASGPHFIPRGRRCPLIRCPFSTDNGSSYLLNGWRSVVVFICVHLWFLRLRSDGCCSRAHCWPFSSFRASSAFCCRCGSGAAIRRAVRDGTCWEESSRSSERSSCCGVCAT